METPKKLCYQTRDPSVLRYETEISRDLNQKQSLIHCKNDLALKNSASRKQNIPLFLQKQKRKEKIN